MSNANYTVSVALKATDGISSVAQKAASSLSSLASQSGGVSTSISSALTGVSSFGSSLSSLNSIVGGLSIFSVLRSGFYSLTEYIDDAIDRFDTLERFPKVLGQMGFDNADAAIKKLEQGIEGLPTALDDISVEAKNLAILFDDLDKGTDVALALNNAMLMSGASVKDYERGVRQLNQMISTGKVDMLSWRSVMETMAPALQTIAESFGYVGASAKNDLYKALQSGEITMTQFTDRIVELDKASIVAGEDFAGFAELAKINTQGIGTSLTNLRIHITKGFTGIFKSINEELTSSGMANIPGQIQKIIGGIDKAFAGFTGSTLFKKGVEAIGVAMQDLERVSGPVFNAIGRAFEALTPFVSNLYNAVKDVGGVFATAIGEIVTGMTDLETATATANALKIAFTPLAETLKAIGGFIAENGVAIGKTITQLLAVAIPLKTLTSAIRAVGEAFKNVGNNLQLFAQNLTKVTSAVSSTTRSLTGFTEYRKNLQNLEVMLGKTGFTLDYFTNKGATAGASLGKLAKSATDYKAKMAEAERQTYLGGSAIDNTAKKASGASNVFNATGNAVNKVGTSFSNIGTKISSIASMFSLFTAGITAVVGIVSLITNMIDQYNQKLRETAIAQSTTYASIMQSADAISNLSSTQADSLKQTDASINAAEVEANTLRNLKDEYNSLIDANGKVKDGYESRADVILTTLANAMGVEKDEIYEMMDRYGKLTSAIDENIEKLKQRAQIAAIESQMKTDYQAIAQAETEQNNLIGKRNELLQEQQRLMTLISEAESPKYGSLTISMDEYNNAKAQLQLVNDQLITLDEKYLESEGIITGANQRIAESTSRMTDVYSGTYAQVDNSLSGIETRLANHEITTQEELDRILSIIQLHIDNATTEADRDVWEGAKENALNYKDELAYKMSEAENNTSAHASTMYKTLDNMQLGQAGSNQSSEYLKSLMDKYPQAVSAGRGLSESAKDGADAVDGSSSGSNFATGFINSIGNFLSGAWNAAVSLGQSALAGLRSAINEGSPSKETYKSGVFFDQGFINGILSKEKEATKTASRLGEETLGALTKSIQDIPQIDDVFKPLSTSNIIKFPKFEVDRLNIDAVTKVIDELDTKKQIDIVPNLINFDKALLKDKLSVSIEKIEAIKFKKEDMQIKETLTPAFNAQYQYGTTIVVPVYLNGREIARATSKDMNKELYTDVRKTQRGVNYV